MPERRVVVTGIGLISPLGSSPDEMWASLSAERSGIDALTRIPTDHLSISCGGEAQQFSGNIGDFGDLPTPLKRQIRKGLKVMCREIQMGVAAAQLAFDDAGLVVGQFDSDRTGVVYGSDYIMTVPEEFTEGIRSCLNDEMQFDFGRWAQSGMPKVTPLWLLKYLPNMPASHIAIYNDLRGPNNSLTLREASANLALSEAFTTIARGGADRIIAGATGTRIHPLRTVHVVLQEELASGDDAAKLARPFDLNRQGSVLGEGAGAVILEELSTAESRGAKVLGEIVGYGSSTVQDRSGTPRRSAAMENAINQTLRSAELTPSDIGHVHAHGLGTRSCDIDEAQAIDRVFGERPVPVPVVAAKSFFGNLGAGGGMIEMISSLLALQHGSLFPILNYETPDPDCPITAARAGDNSGDSFISLSVSPQAQASAVLMRRF
jgi:3-oxoacyl-[acyl-carrier-protein] synthase II